MVNTGDVLSKGNHLFKVCKAYKMRQVRYNINKTLANNTIMSAIQILHLHFKDKSNT